jgi:hypothetical protein
MAKLELWIGVVEFKPLDRKAYGAAGSFTNIITWAQNQSEFRDKAAEIALTMNLYVAEIENVEPVAEREKRNWVPSEEIEDMLLRAESHPNAIVYGTFHRYPNNIFRIGIL